MKAAIIVLSDPNNGEDALGRVFNALATAYDFQHQGDEVSVLFQGAGTRWVSELNKSNHPVHELFNAVKDTDRCFLWMCRGVWCYRSSRKIWF